MNYGRNSLSIFCTWSLPSISFFWVLDQFVKTMQIFTQTISFILVLYLPLGFCCWVELSFCQNLRRLSKHRTWHIKFCGVDLLMMFRLKISTLCFVHCGIPLFCSTPLHGF